MIQKKTPLITTLLPTYKRPQRLKKAIESVLAQSCGDFILKVFDNASCDATQEVVLTYQKKDPRVIYVERETNIGLTRNFSEALKHVDTPLFSFLGDDDALLPDFYKSTLKGFEEYPEIGFSATKARVITSKESFLTGPSPGFRPLEVSATEIIKGHPHFFAILFSSKILNKVNGINDSLGYIFDLDFTYRTTLYFPFHIADEIGVQTLFWEGSASSLLPDLERVKNLQRLDESLEQEKQRANRSQVNFAPFFVGNFKTKFFSHLFNKRFLESQACLDGLEKHLSVDKLKFLKFYYRAYQISVLRPMIKTYIRKVSRLYR